MIKSSFIPNKGQCVLLYICFILYTCGLSAQQASDTITGKVHRISEVTVKARRVPSKITTTAPSQTFSKKDFESLGL